MKGLKIAVTGVGGFFNTRLLRHYDSRYTMSALTHQDLDITKAEEVRRILTELKPDIVIHGAAITSTLDCERNPNLAYKVNVEGALNIARVTNEINAKMVFYSSEQVFNGNIQEGPYSEEIEAVPNTVYGKTKLEAETLLRQEKQDLWILRFSWLFGLPERNMPMGTNLVWNVIKAGLKESPIKVAVHEFRGITHAYDIIDNFDKVFHIPYGTYHFGSINNVSTYNTAVYILQQIGMEEDKINKILIPDYEKYRENKRDLRLDYHKIMSTGIPIVSSLESINRALNEYAFKL